MKGAVSDKFCKICGNGIKKSVLFCSKCGAKTASDPELIQNQLKKSSTSPVVWIFLIIILAIIGYYQIKQSNPPILSGVIEPYPQEVVQNYMKTCVVEGLYPFCKCSIDYLQKSMSLRQFNELEKEYLRTNIMPSGFQGAIDACEYTLE